MCFGTVDDIFGGPAEAARGGGPVADKDGGPEATALDAMGAVPPEEGGARGILRDAGVKRDECTEIGGGCCAGIGAALLNKDEVGCIAGGGC